jgi:hypothetical protein
LSSLFKSKLRHWPPATNKRPFVAPFFLSEVFDAFETYSTIPHKRICP